jgi:uncharacterized protein (UPF0332 family)
MDENTKELIKYRLTKADEELELAALCIDSNIFSKSLNCSYYAIFHSTRALLAIEKRDFKKHSAVIAYFINNFVQNGIFPAEFGKIIKSSETDRSKSDYHDFYVVSKEEAIMQLGKAKFFVNKITEYLESIIGTK